jgi:hypothetical protein
MAINTNDMNKLLSMLIVLILFTSFNHLKAQVPFKSHEPITRVHNKIEISVIPEVELISIVQTISKYPTVLGFLMVQDSSEYKTDVLNHFHPYRNHPAVLMFDRLSLQPGMLNFSAPSNIMLYVDESLNLKKDIELDDFVIKRTGGIDSLEVFLDLLGDFATQSSFNDFYDDHKDFYSTIIENTIVNIGSRDYINELESFYGKDQQSYNIVLVSLYNFVGFGNSILRANEKRDLFNTMGPKSVIKNIPFFGDEDYLKHMIRHEFSHPFINPLTEEYWAYIKDYSGNYDSIATVAHERICGDWQECINEFIIRAITTQLAFNESEESGLQAYEKEKAKGVSNMDSLLNKIRYYQSNRESYPTLKSYYLNVLDVFIEE